MEYKDRIVCVLHWNAIIAGVMTLATALLEIFCNGRGAAFTISITYLLYSVFHALLVQQGLDIGDTDSKKKGMLVASFAMGVMFIGIIAIGLIHNYLLPVSEKWTFYVLGGVLTACVVAVLMCSIKVFNENK